MDTRIPFFGKQRLTTILPLSFLLATSFLLGACEQTEQAYVPVSRPVKTIVVGSAGGNDTRTFPAVVDAIQKADISFRVSGKIQKILVKEGDHVKKGQVLAELDPTDFEITLKDRQASFDTAKANFNRAKTLVAKGVISKVEHDEIRAKFYTAKANLEAAKQDLNYTRLKASFDGIIAKRHVENFEEVVLSRPVFSLEDVSALKVQIDIPENLAIVINKKRKGDRKLRAIFDSIPGQNFPLRYIESSSKADPNTRTFKVTLKMENPVNYNILPGMTATVFAELLPEESASASSIAVPVSAVIADNDKQATVWVVNGDSMTVSPKTVEPGPMVGDTMLVTGLTPGERIVIAGASFLRKDMKVTLLKTGEQAQ